VASAARSVANAVITMRDCRRPRISARYVVLGIIRGTCWPTTPVRQVEFCAARTTHHQRVRSVAALARQRWLMIATPVVPDSLAKQVMNSTILGYLPAQSDHFLLNCNQDLGTNL
jgi:hypothetical protein